MALNITSPLKTAQGFELSNTYARVAVADQYQGKQLAVDLNVYASKEAFDADAFALNIVETQIGAVVAYDRATMSKDILDYAHDVLIQLLEQQGVTATKVLD